ncbi:MAG TPA: GNAT family N-acetyltransferase [Ktedonobacterales bacterium]
MDCALDELTPGHADEAIALWNSALGADLPMTPRLWRQVVTDDPNAMPGDAIAARAADGALAGFILTRQFHQLDLVPAMESTRGSGWILALIVAPALQRRGLGSQLLRAAEERLQAHGATRCTVGGGIEHLLPGQPLSLAADPGDQPMLEFWRQHGYTPSRAEYDLRRNLSNFLAPPVPPLIRNGTYQVAPGKAGDEAALLAFVGREFPGRWHYDITQALARGLSIEDVILLKDNTATIQGFLCSWHHQSVLLGPSTYWYPALGDRFGGIGPLGIAQGVRGNGLGLALVAAGVETLRRRGVEECAVDWTTLIDFYGALGFHVSRRYCRFEPKTLSA